MKLFGGRSKRASGRRFIGAKKGAAGTVILALWRDKRVRIAIIVVAVLGALGISAAAAWSMTTRLPDLPDEVTPPPNDSVHAEPTFDNNPPVSPTPVRVSETSPEPVLRKQGCYTFLICGTADNYTTDTIMAGMLDTAAGTLNFVSIPRDTMVNVKRDVKKINSAYGIGNATQKGQGVEQLKAEVKTILGYTPDYYAVVNMKGFERLVNAVDGVTFDVPVDMYKQMDDGMLIDLKKGVQKLNGNQALQLVRWRDFAGNDYRRMQVQQELLKTIAKQVMQVKNVFKLPEFVDIAVDNLETNLKTTEMLAFANELLNYDMDSINFYTMPTTSGKWYSESAHADLWYEYVEVEPAVEMINETIYPFNKPLEKEDLDILILKK